MNPVLALSLLTLGQIGPGVDGPAPSAARGQRPPSNYQQVVRDTASMAQNPQAQRLARRAGLDVLNVTWEDTGRYKGSAVGPNISDMTIQVAVDRGRGRMETLAMPVIRFPNFSDKTADIDPRFFALWVGNERGRRLQRVSLHDFLAEPTAFMHRPSSWRGRNRTLLAPRDTEVLVSAQAAFLPVPRQGKATFNPVLFNYQSVEGDPAVLTILATREGTSMTVIQNKDRFGKGTSWGQPLFFNKNGQRASFTGERLSDFINNPANSDEADRPNLNMVLLIQVPLVQRNPDRGAMPPVGATSESAPAMARGGGGGGGSDVESAVIGHGELEGPFEELAGLEVRRDTRFPIRVTVQFYKATSNGVVSEQDVREIREDLDRVYNFGSSVGSLVTEGETGRPTEYWGLKVQPRSWWTEFWVRHYENTGQTPAQARARLERILGRDYMRRPVNDLYLSDVLRQPSR